MHPTAINRRGPTCATRMHAAASPGSQTRAPGTVRWNRLAIFLEEAAQHVQKPQDVLTVAVTLGSPDTLDNHVSDFFGAVL